MQSTIIILLVFVDFYQSQQKECICECCLDDNINCIPTFRSAININPLLKCDDITCNKESCLTFSQCSIAFGKIVASCENDRAFSSSSVRTTFGCTFLIMLLVFTCEYL